MKHYMQFGLYQRTEQSTQQRKSFGKKKITYLGFVDTGKQRTECIEKQTTGVYEKKEAS